MLVLADQAAVTAEDLRRLAMNWRRQPDYIVAAQYGATLGAPAIFPASYFGTSWSCAATAGAQSLFKRNPDRVIRVPMDSASVDIDTPEDLLRLESARR